MIINIYTALVFGLTNALVQIISELLSDCRILYQKWSVLSFPRHFRTRYIKYSLTYKLYL